jgi:putative chitinase
MHIEYADLRRLCPTGDPGLMAEIVRYAPEMLPRYGIDTPLRWCHLVAQLAHESAGFRTTVEYASGAAYEMRADLGNIYSGDGTRFRGRGLIQLTGRANYRRVGAAIGRPLEDAPELAAEFPAALETALVYWRDRRLNQYADADDAEMVTRAINGGLNGFADRLRYLSVAKAIWGAADHIVEPNKMVRPTIRPGASGPAVRTLQTALNRLMPERPPLVVDGHFGSRTEVALLAWQGSAGLAADGICGPGTWASFDADHGPPPIPDLPDEPEPPATETTQPANPGGFFISWLKGLFR